MILISLIDQLEEDFKKVFKENPYQTKNGEEKTPDIKTGWYTSKSRSKDSEFPYVLISPVEQVDITQESNAELMIIFAAHSLDEDGWKDSALMAEKIRQYLGKNHVIGDRYEIGSEIKITFPDEQPYPQWFCWIHLKFKIYNPVEEVNYD